MHAGPDYRENRETGACEIGKNCGKLCGATGDHVGAYDATMFGSGAVSGLAVALAVAAELDGAMGPAGIGPDRGRRSRDAARPSRTTPADPDAVHPHQHAGPRAGAIWTKHVRGMPAILGIGMDAGARHAEPDRTLTQIEGIPCVQSPPGDRVDRRGVREEVWLRLSYLGAHRDRDRHRVGTRRNRDRCGAHHLAEYVERDR